MEVLIITTLNANPNGQNSSKQPEDLVNEMIRFPEVLVIGPDGAALGVKSRLEAMRIAESYQLDLLCVAPQARPPVCKILDYGKHRFEQQKKTREAKKNQKIIETKEVRLTPQIDLHDMETKVRAVIKWLEEGNKVKVALRFRGRQLAHIDVGEATMETFLKLCLEHSVLEKKPLLDGKFLIAYLAPKK